MAGTARPTGNLIDVLERHSRDIRRLRSKLAAQTFDFSLSSHDHDADYSDIAHNHDADYSDISHDHDTDYLSLGGGTLTNDLTIIGGPRALKLKTDGTGSDHTYLEFYPDDADLNDRGGYIGYPSAGTTHLNVINEMTGDLILGSDGVAFHITDDQSGSFSNESPAFSSGFPGRNQVSLAQNGILAASREGTTAAYIGRSDASDGTLVAWYRNNVVVGSVSVSSGATSYNTSSDERLKKNIVDHGTAKALNEVKAMRVRDFEWLDGTPANGPGLVAQEVMGVMPELVTLAEEDPLTPGQSHYQIDYGKLTPILLGAVQEQQNQIDALQAQIDALTS